MATVEFIQKQLNISEKSINNTLQLLAEDGTITLFPATEKIRPVILTKHKSNRFQKTASSSRTLLKEKNLL